MQFSWKAAALPLVGLVLALTPGAGRAQGVFNMGALTNTLSIPTGSEAGKSSSRPATGKATSGVVLRYVPTASLQAQTLRTYTTRLKTSDPAAAQSLTRVLGSANNSYPQLYKAMLGGSGFEDNDVASALALYLEVGYRVVRDIRDDKVVTPVQERGLRAQVAQLLAQTGAPATPAAAARLGEEFKLQSVVLTLGWAQARQAGSDAAYRQATARQFKASYGFDFQQAQLTNAGFVPRR